MRNISKTKNKFCKTKCVKLNFYKCFHFLLLWRLSTVWIYHFYCFPFSFLLLYLSFHIDSLHRHPDFCCLHDLSYHQWYHKKKVTLKYLEFKICKVWANNYDWMKCYLRLCQREAQPVRNYQFFRNLFQFKTNYAGNIKILIDLFDKMILPICTYNCEVWGASFFSSKYSPRNFL